MRTISVIVVSHGRPEALRRCLLALEQIDYSNFEVIIVADEPSLQKLKNWPFQNWVKSALVNEENISRARNIGITLAAGEIVAFIDDDSIAEPTWLTHLAQAFEASEVASAGGYVRGRNGISWQWEASTVDGAGVRHPLKLAGGEPEIAHAPPGEAIKTEGTNMAFRREILAEIGGFDLAFRIFLDESDVNLRLARAGYAAAIVPRAEVHHGFAESSRRRSDRVPRDLFEIGASYSAFLLRHCPLEQHAHHQAAFAGEERKRLVRHMVAGRLEPRDVPRLMRRLQEGFVDGQDRTPEKLPCLPSASAPFSPRPPRAHRHPTVHCGRWIFRRSIRRKAAADVALGHVSTAIIFSLTAFFGRVRFTDRGFWEHRGGQFGLTERSDRLFRWQKLTSKCRQEIARIGAPRGLQFAKGKRSTE